jgi:hypothetical protein
MKTNLKAQLEAFEKGIFLDSEGEDSWCFNFYDWFCKDTSLERKARSLYAKVKKFLKANPQIDTTKVYVFFKNNCPMVGPLYDDFRICDLENDGNIMFTVVPKCGHSGKAEIWGRKNNFEGPLKVSDTFTGLLS